MTKTKREGFYIVFWMLIGVLGLITINNILIPLIWR